MNYYFRHNNIWIYLNICYFKQTSHFQFFTFWHLLYEQHKQCINWKNMNRIIIIFSAVKLLIAINRIQNKSLYLQIICVSTVYMYYAYINTLIQYIYIFGKYWHVYIYINIIYNINKIYLIYKREIFFLNIYPVCVCIHLYIINVHNTHTYIM